LVANDEALARVEARLTRAYSHARAFDQWIESIKATGTYGVVRETNLDGSEHIYKIEAPNQPSERFSTIASDCLHNARAALDNLVYRLAQLNLYRVGQVIPDDYKAHAFPISESGKKFRARKKECLAFLSSEARGLIRDFQPYMRSQPFDADPLWTLRELQNVDKHRFLVRVVLDFENIKWDGYPSPGEDPLHPTQIWAHDLVEGTTVEFVAGPGWATGATVEDDVELCRFILDPPNLELDLHVEPTFVVTLDEGPGGGQPLPGALLLILSRVNELLNRAKALPECQ
jgi:hypothetical protein